MTKNESNMTIREGVMSVFVLVDIIMAIIADCGSALGW